MKISVNVVGTNNHMYNQPPKLYSDDYSPKNKVLRKLRQIVSLFVKDSSHKAIAIEKKY